MNWNESWKKILRGILLAGLAALAVYLFCTPMGALRLGVALSGHPVAAVTLQARAAEAKDVGLTALDNPAGTTIYRITHAAPYCGATGTVGRNWIVTRVGPICLADYYGWL